MKYEELSMVVSSGRLKPYLEQCHNDKAKALVLYRYNIRLSMELFTVLGAVEVALRNRIDSVMSAEFGENWLKDSARPGGVFYPSDKKYKLTEKQKKHLLQTAQRVKTAEGRIVREKAKMKYLAKDDERRELKNSDFISEMSFGFWVTMFEKTEYKVTNKCLMKCFPSDEKCFIETNVNNRFIRETINALRDARNKIAHNHSIVFDKTKLSSVPCCNVYKDAKILLVLMNIDPASYLFGLDHVLEEIEKVDGIVKR